MAYTIAQLINEYNSMDAVMLSNAVIKRHGIINSATYYLANKDLAHTYTNYGTLPTAGIRSLANGVANSTVQGTTVTKNLSLFSANGAWDSSFVSDLTNHYNTQAPVYFASLADSILSAVVYGTNATLGNASYTGVGLQQYVNTYSGSMEVKQFQITGSAANCTSMFAVRYSPYENMDGAAIALGFLNGVNLLFYVNNNWIDPITIAGADGPFEGYQMFFKMNGVMILPGTNNVSAIRGIQANSTLTIAMVDDMLDAVKADGNTVIYVNGRTKSMLQGLKASKMVIDTSNLNFDTRVYSWDGVPIIVTDSITNTLPGTLYGLS